MSTKSRIREQAQKGIYDGLKESISDFSDETIQQTASDIEDAVFQYFDSDEHNKKYNEKILFLKMRIKGSRNSKTRSVLLQRKIDLKELIELKSNEFTDQFFSEKLGQGDNSGIQKPQSSNILSQLNDEQDQELSNAPPPQISSNPFSANPFQRAVPSQTNAASNRIGGKSRYVNPNQQNQQQAVQQSQNAPIIPPSEIELPNISPPTDTNQLNVPVSVPLTNTLPSNTFSPFFNEDSPPKNPNNFYQSPAQNETNSKHESPQKQNEQIYHIPNYDIDVQFNYQNPASEIETKKQEKQPQAKNTSQKPVPTFNAPPPPPTRQTQKQNIPHPTRNEQHHFQSPQQHVENESTNFETPQILNDYQDSCKPNQQDNTHQQVPLNQKCDTSTSINNQDITNMINEAVNVIQNNLLQQFQLQNNQNQSKIEQLEKKLNSQAQQSSSHQSHDNSLSHQQTSILEQKIFTLNQTIQNYQILINNLENSIYSLTTQVANIKSTQEQQTILLNQGNIRSSNQINQTEVEQYTNMINNLKQENIELRNQLNTSKENESQNKLTIQKMTILIDQLQAQNNQLQEKNEQLGQSIVQLNHSLNEIQQVSQLQKQQIMQLTSNQIQAQQQQQIQNLQQVQQQNQQILEQQKQANKTQQHQQNNNNPFNQSVSNQNQQLQPPQQQKQQQQSSPQTVQKQQISQPQHHQNSNPTFNQQNSNYNPQKTSNSINQQMSYFEAEDFFDSLNGSQVVQNNLQSNKNDDAQRNSVQVHHVPPQIHNAHQNSAHYSNSSSSHPPAQNYPQKSQSNLSNIQNQQTPPVNIPQNHQNVGYNQNQVQQQQQQTNTQSNRAVVPAPAGGIVQKQRRAAKGFEDMFN